MIWDLPVQWQWKPAEFLVEDTDRRNPKRTPEETFRYVDISSVDNEIGVIKLEEVREIKGAEAPSRARKVIRGGDVIFATTRPYLRNIALVPGDLDDEICSTGFCVLRPRKGQAISEFVYYASRTVFFINQIIPKQRGASYPAVTDSDVYETLLPVPYPDDPERSLAEQRRIVARIEALLGEVREMRKLQEEIAADASHLFSVTLTDFFAQQVSESSEWDWVALEDLGETKSGGTPRKSVEEYWGGTIPWVSPKDMKTRFIGKTQDYVTQLGVDNSSAKIVRAGAILIVFRSGILAHSLPVAIATRDLTTNQDLKALTLHSAYDSEYIAYAIQNLERYIVNNCVKKGPTVHSIVSDRFWQVRVPVPSGENSLSLQRQIVSKLNSAQSEISEMRELTSSKGALIENLEQSILAQAFRGEL